MRDGTTIYVVELFFLHYRTIDLKFNNSGTTFGECSGSVAPLFPEVFKSIS